MKIDPFKEDCDIAKAVLYCGKDNFNVSANSGLILYYRAGKVEVREEFIPSRESEILGFFGYAFGQNKYHFTLGKNAHARIVPTHKKQVVVNESVMADIGETIRVQNSERSIDLLLCSRH